jgi:hypothetical protein
VTVALALGMLYGFGLMVWVEIQKTNFGDMVIAIGLMMGLILFFALLSQGPDIVKWAWKQLKN